MKITVTGRAGAEEPLHRVVWEPGRLECSEAALAVVEAVGRRMEGRVFHPQPAYAWAPRTWSAWLQDACSAEGLITLALPEDTEVERDLVDPWWLDVPPGATP